MIEIKPLQKCAAVVSIPGSKSYTHRALITSSLAEGVSFLTNALRSEDTLFTAKGLEKMGIKITWEKEGVRVEGKGGSFKKGVGNIYLGNSGTSMRFLTALAALREGRTCLDGSTRLRERPMGELLKALSALKVKAYALNNNGCAPIIVDSQGLGGGKVVIKGMESSQFLSALLLVSPYSQREVVIEVEGRLASQPYVEMTREVMSAFGVEVLGNFPIFYVRHGQHYTPQNYLIDGDASNASYFWAAAALTKGRIEVNNLRPDSAQGDLKFLELLQRMGCQIKRKEEGIEVQGAALKGIEADMNSMPDVVPTLAILGAFAAGETIISNIEHLRYKESDRVKAIANELRKMGVQVAEGRDWLKITGGQIHGAEIETYQDHRLAMSFAIAGLVVPGIKIKGEECVAKSFPDFWEKLRELY